MNSSHASTHAYAFTGHGWWLVEIDVHVSAALRQGFPRAVRIVSQQNAINYSVAATREFADVIHISVSQQPEDDRGILHW